MHLKPLSSPKACILVLEPDPFLRAGLGSVLRSAGHRIAEDESDGVRIDLVLAGLDGRKAPEAAQQAAEHAAPVILLVDRGAWTGLDFLDAANALGATAVLQRPFSRATLLRLVARILAGSDQGAAATAGELPGLPELLLQLENSHFA